MVMLVIGFLLGGLWITFKNIQQKNQTYSVDILNDLIPMEIDRIVETKVEGDYRIKQIYEYGDKNMVDLIDIIVMTKNEAIRRYGHYLTKEQVAESVMTVMSVLWPAIALGSKADVRLSKAFEYVLNERMTEYNDVA